MARAAAAEAGSDTRERILAAALEAFAEKGFDGATTRDIASRAGVNLGLLPYHFGDKSGLWKAAVERAFAEMQSGVDAALADAAGDEREHLRRLIRAHVRFVAHNPAFIRIMHDEGKRRGPRMRWLVDRHVKPLYEGLRSFLDGAQRARFLPAAIPPVHFLYALVGAAGVIFHQSEECKRLAGVDPFDPEVVEAHARAVEHLFLGPPDPEDHS